MDVTQLTPEQLEAALAKMWRDKAAVAAEEETRRKRPKLVKIQTKRTRKREAKPKPSERLVCAHDGPNFSCDAAPWRGGYCKKHFWRAHSAKPMDLP